MTTPISRTRWAALAIALASCGPRPLPGRPALWRIDGPHGERGWLLGTIHALPRPVAWRTPQIGAALDQANQLVVEIAALNDAGAGAAIFARLAHGPPQPPLDQRIAPALRPQLAALLQRSRLSSARFSDMKSWAAALILAQAAQGASDGAAAQRGVDRALLRDNPGKPVAELEGMSRQLGLFDSLPETAQRALLSAVIAGADHAGRDSARLAEAWRTGDIAAIARETGAGMMADPTLRRVLYEQRNRDWARAIAADLATGMHPLVAVGAAHMAGAEGLPSLLTARGFIVTRVE